MEGNRTYEFFSGWLRGARDPSFGGAQLWEVERRQFRVARSPLPLEALTLPPSAGWRESCISLDWSWNAV